MGLFDLFSKKSKLTLEDVRAADRGEPEAKRKLQNAFDAGLSADEHNALRRQAYCLKAESGDPVAQYWMGFLSSVIDRNPEQAIYWYEMAAKQGNVEAMKDLAFGYGEFLNESQLDYGAVPLGYDENKELYWLQMAAAYGDEESKQKLERR